LSDAVTAVIFKFVASKLQCPHVVLELLFYFALQFLMPYRNLTFIFCLLHISASFDVIVDPEASATHGHGDTVQIMDLMLEFSQGMKTLHFVSVLCKVNFQNALNSHNQG